MLDLYNSCFSFSFSWSSYKINQQQDKIGVFVSIVSTKIPFKGTGKEYIGDDITEISSAVKVHSNIPYELFSYGHLISSSCTCSQRLSSAVFN